MVTLERTPGRRASDKWLLELAKLTTVAPVMVRRRPRRTKAQIRNALVRARAQVRADHPQWTSKQVKRRAHSLVRQYKIV